MAEGWACYALRPDGGDRAPLAARAASPSSTRASRLAARAVADLRCTAASSRSTRRRASTRSMGLMPAAAARGEAVQELDVPGHGGDVLAGHARDPPAARRAARARRAGVLGAGASTIELLGHGSIPVALIARLMTQGIHVKMTRTWCLVVVGMLAAGVRPRARGRTGRLERAAHRRLRPRARHAQPLQHAHPRGHPDLRHRGADDHRREDEHRAAARGRGADARRTAASRCARTAAWTSPGSCAPASSGTTARRCTSADVKFTVDAINDPAYNPESTDGFDRICVGRHARPADRGRPLPEVYAPYALQFIRGTLPKHVLEGRDIDRAQRLQPHAARHRPVPGGRVEERRVHPARARAELLARRRSSRRSSRSCSASSPTPTRASTS